jgi:ssDNA-binding replication factor A large subunit
MPLTSADALNLAKAFRDLSVTIGDYRFTNWNALSVDDRKTLEDEEWSLLNASSDMVTKAVGLALDESDPGAQKVQGAAAAAQKAVKTLNEVRKVITVATAAVGLAAAIISKDPGAIVKNSKAVFDAVTA